MREYRGKRVDNGEWVEGYLYQTDKRSFIIPQENIAGTSADDNNSFGLLQFERSYIVIPETVCQYTGRKDRTGKEIYEGDKVRGEIDEEVHEWVISWEETEQYCGWPLGRDNEPLKVIGNIHDKQEAK